MTTAKPRKTATPPPRTKNKGWTKHAALRNRKFLWSVVPEKLSGYGFSVTHTVRTCPTPDLWSKWLKKYFRHLRDRYPLTRFHQVTEWQIRGMPHLHAAIWFAGEVQPADGSEPERVRKPVGGSGPNGSIIEGKDIPRPEDLSRIWLRITKEGGSEIYGQDVKTINTKDAGHWLQYLAKHAVRGVSNYQRSSKNIPPEWKGRTGQVWGKGGDWPTENVLEVHGLAKSEEYQYRRIFCRYLASLPPSMRLKTSERASVRKFWQKWLKCPDIMQSRVRAPSSFIRREDQIRIIRSINADVWFSDAVTGEVFTSADEVSLDRAKSWHNAPIYRTEATMEDLRTSSR